jgi:hypothetical protein
VGSAPCLSPLVYLSYDFLYRQLEGPFLPFGPAEGAETASVDADICRVDVSVADEVCFFAVSLFGDVRCESAEGEKVVRFKELQGVFFSQTFSCEDLFLYKSNQAIKTKFAREAFRY